MSEDGEPAQINRTEAIACEAALARLLGSTAEVALAAAARVVDTWPDLGVLTLSGVAAARWGIDLVPAVVRLSTGDALHGAISDYEQRFAAEEALDGLLEERDKLSQRLRQTHAGDAEPAALVETELAAVDAALSGVTTWAVPATAPEGTHARVGALAASLGVAVEPRRGHHEKEHPSALLRPAWAGPAYVGFGALLTR